MDQNQMSLAWMALSKALGTYTGKGINHEGQNYTNNFQIKEVLKQKLFQINSTAKGDNGEVYHEEISWLGKDIFGTLTLFVNSYNHPGVTPHPFHRIEEDPSGEKSIIFRFGNPEDKSSFREEIALTLFTDGSLKQQYFWGVPGGEFQPRSGARMYKGEQ